MNFATPTWNADGMVPAVVQHAETGVVLMLAYVNAEALALTRSTGLAHFWSRSRSSLWKKGESSGNTLRVVELRLDCDADALLFRCLPAGPTCHTGTTSCFFDADGADATDDGPLSAPVDVLRRLETTLTERKHSATAARSYSKALLDGGANAIIEKLVEEQGELSVELRSGTDARVVSEAADLLFHVAVALVSRGVALDDVWHELARREGVSGHVEKAARTT